MSKSKLQLRFFSPRELPESEARNSLSKCLERMHLPDQPLLVTKDEDEEPYVVVISAKLFRTLDSAFADHVRRFEARLLSEAESQDSGGATLQQLQDYEKSGGPASTTRD